MSNFSCVYWLSVCLFWRNVYLGVLHIFWLNCLFVFVVELYELFVNFGNSPLLTTSFANIFSHSVICLLVLFMVSFAVIYFIYFSQTCLPSFWFGFPDMLDSLFFLLSFPSGSPLLLPPPPSSSIVFIAIFHSLYPILQAHFHVFWSSYNFLFRSLKLSFESRFFFFLIYNFSETGEPWFSEPILFLLVIPTEVYVFHNLSLH